MCSSKPAMEIFVITIQLTLQYPQTEVSFHLLYKKQFQKNALGSWILFLFFLAGSINFISLTFISIAYLAGFLLKSSKILAKISKQPRKNFHFNRQAI